MCQRNCNEISGGRGADLVFECSGAGPAAQICLDLVRRRGRYAQVGLFGQPVQWDLCYKEVQVSGSFATVASSWRKALTLLASEQFNTQALISHTMPITNWSEAFDIFESQRG